MAKIENNFAENFHMKICPFSIVSSLYIELKYVYILVVWGLY